MAGGTQNEEHELLIDELIYVFGSRQEIRIWKRPVGQDSVTYVKYGIPGESDLEGIIFPSGRMLCVEAKTGKATLSPKQKERKELIEKFGGLWITARSTNYEVEKGAQNALDEYLEKDNTLF